MEFITDDGGREQAGFKGSTGDCACRAVAIVTGKPYLEVYSEINALGEVERTSKKRRGKSHARTGVYKATMKRYLASLGFAWTPTMGIGTGCTVHLRDGELPQGRLLVSLSKHYAAVIDGVIHDTYNPARDGTRCVYGYWTFNN